MANKHLPYRPEQDMGSPRRKGRPGRKRTPIRPDCDDTPAQKSVQAAGQPSDAERKRVAEVQKHLDALPTTLGDPDSAFAHISDTLP